MDYQTQNDELVANFLNRHFFSGWKNRSHPVTNNLELIVTPDCDLRCTYCYYTRFGSKLYPPSINDPLTILHNLNLVLDWLTHNKYYPDIEIFSGELFSHELGFVAFERIVDHLVNNNKNQQLIVPTNGNFIIETNKVKRLTATLDKAKNIIPINISISVDGKYMDYCNRPSCTGVVRNDYFYNRLFEFAKTYNAGFHPMIYYKGIERWWENFLWFMDKFEEFDIDWTRLYLLEVRNEGWDSHSSRIFRDLILNIGDYIVNRLQKYGITDPEQQLDYIFKHKLFNIFSSLGTISRGIGCGIQSFFNIRLGDLKSFPCHRLAYPVYNTLEGKVEDNKLIGFEARNWPMLIAIASFSAINQPYCQDCFIKHMCLYGCLGSQFESMNNPFLPNPSVCLLSHAKFDAIAKIMKKHAWPIRRLADDKVATLYTYFTQLEK